MVSKQGTGGFEPQKHSRPRLCSTGPSPGKMFIAGPSAAELPPGLATFLEWRPPTSPRSLPFPHGDWPGSQVLGRHGMPSKGGAGLLPPPHPLCLGTLSGFPSVLPFTLPQPLSASVLGTPITSDHPLGSNPGHRSPHVGCSCLPGRKQRDSDPAFHLERLLEVMGPLQLRAELSSEV